MKKIAQMRRDELIELALENEVDVDDEMTKVEIKNAILDAGIDDESRKQPDKVDTAKPAETEDEILIRMTRQTKHYKYGKYLFTDSDPFAVMSKKDAENILKDNPDGFRKSSEDEIRSFFN